MSDTGGNAGSIARRGEAGSASSARRPPPSARWGPRSLAFAGLCVLLVSGCDTSNPNGSGEAPQAAEQAGEGAGGRAPARRSSSLPAHGEASSWNVEIDLGGTEPRDLPLEAGTYVLSLDLTYDGGVRLDRRFTAHLAVSGDRLELRLERARTGLLSGRMESGRFELRGTEGGAEIELHGWVTGPGEARGRVTGADAESGKRIQDGRFSLVKVR